MSGDAPGPLLPRVLLVVAGILLLMHLPPTSSCSQVETEDRFEWIGGSSIGGGTFWGLGALLTKTKVPWQLQEDAPGSVWLSPGPFRKGLVPVGSEAVPGGNCHQSASFLGLVPPLFPGSLKDRCAVTRSVAHLGGSLEPCLSPRPMHSLFPFGLGFRGRRDPTQSRLLCPQKFDELLQLASRGQHANVDMLVQDIYGGAHQTLGLSGNLIASSFGKSATADQGTSVRPAVPARPPPPARGLASSARPLSPPEFSQEDMAKSLLHMISNDIGQLACLYARLHRLDRVYFGGFFIRGHPVTMRTITYSINFFSKVTGAPPPPLLHPGLCSARRSCAAPRCLQN